MSNFYRDNDDLNFYVEKWLDWAPLVDLTERGSDEFKSTAEAVDFYKDVLDLIGQFTADEIAPHGAHIDEAGVQLVDGEVVFPKKLDAIFEQIKDMELHGMCLPRELGGMNCPLALYLIATEIMARGDVSTMAHFGFHGGMAMAMLVFSMREGTTEVDADGKVVSTRFADYIEEIRRGDAWGCMDITEPGAGSDMARLRAVGEQDDAGAWFVTGNKIFITSGHGKYHFVIARTEKPANPDDPFAGLAGLSMFLVPAYTEDADGRRTRIVTIDRLEEKMGHHGSATASLQFDRAPAQLIGKRGDGFKYMLTLMNNARLGVGFESLGLCEASYRAAREYAEQRPSMGKTIDQHEMIADYLSEMETDIIGIRALAMQGTWAEEMSHKIEMFSTAGRITAESQNLKKYKARARRVTPLLKYLAAEKAVELSRRCIQIHGGNGYTRDFPAEKLMRDAMVMPIYEGTSQIQALMAMKDTLTGIMKNPQRFLKRLAQARWRSVSARDPLERRLAKLQSVSLSAQQHLMTRTAADKYRSLAGKPVTEWPTRFAKNWDPKKDFSYAMLHAERLTQILADELIAELLYEQARKFPERQPHLEKHLERAEPRARYLYDVMTTTGDSLLAHLRGEQDAERKVG